MARVSRWAQMKVHWIDKLADEVEEELRRRGKKEVYTFNGGLSVSGAQHIGRLRGEVILVEALRRILESRGFRVRQLLTLYTQDPWKGKKAQREAFSDPEEAKRYTGWPLIRVPDPKGCHSNWVEHFWSDFGPYLAEFTDGRIEVVYTHELYAGPLGDFALLSVKLRDKIRRVINKYRGRKPYPEGWIPIEARCQRCGRIDTTETLEVDEAGRRVRYRCKHCGHEGWAPLSETKLNWRLEWVGVWKVLSVDFEPYGKDHATPGGSRDSCVDLAVNVFGFEPPAGRWYEWVAMRVNGREMDMTSSGFIAITPREWLRVAHPQILRFLYLYHKPQRRIVIDLAELPNYYEMYYKAERIYFGVDTTGDEEEDAYLARTYELSHPRSVPEKLPSQPPYAHVAILAQIIPPELLPGEALRRLQATGHLSRSPDEYSLNWASSLVEKARHWSQAYAPRHLRISIPEEPPLEAYKRIIDPSRLERLASVLESLEEWSEVSIKDALMRFGEGMTPRERRVFYRDLYLAILGQPEGPRAAPLLSLLPKGWVVERLRAPARLLEDRGG
jgi:lysyl-tRNA synthetase class 1